MPGSMEFRDTRFSSNPIIKIIIIRRLFLLLSSIILVSMGIPSALAQIPSSGTQCPTKSPSVPINLKKFAGNWYEVEASPTFFEYPLKCISIKIPPFFEKTTEVTIDAINRISQGNGSVVLKLAAKIPEHSNEVDGLVTLTVIPSPRLHEGAALYGPHVQEEYAELPIQILATDYNNWAVVWMCQRHEKANAHTEFIWVLSRQRTLIDKYYRAVLEAKQVHRLEGIKTRDTIQTRCFKSKLTAQSDWEDDDGGHDNDY